MADRVRMQTLALATTALSQGASFWHAGGDLLRSKSLDRNSYDSGDWFNVLDFGTATTASAAGCRRRPDNEAKWEYMRRCWPNPALKPRAADIAERQPAGRRAARRSGSSTPLFHLGTRAGPAEGVIPRGGPTRHRA